MKKEIISFVVDTIEEEKIKKNWKIDLRGVLHQFGDGE
jgi:hypothetical protein